MRYKTLTRSKFKTAKRGFTMIELLVVVSIIGLLTSVVLASVNNARIKARDSKRLSDLKQIDTAIRLYNDKYDYFPRCRRTVQINGTTDCLSSTLRGQGYFSRLPTDPLAPANHSPYDYYVDLSTSKRYAIRVYLEGGSVAATGDHPNGSCDSALPICGWYQTCVYKTGSSCTALTKTFGSD